SPPVGTPGRRHPGHPEHRSRTRTTTQGTRPWQTGHLHDGPRPGQPHRGGTRREPQKLTRPRSGRTSPARTEHRPHHKPPRAAVGRRPKAKPAPSVVPGGSRSRRYPRAGPVLAARTAPGRGVDASGREASGCVAAPPVGAPSPRTCTATSAPTASSHPPTLPPTRSPGVETWKQRRAEEHTSELQSRFELVCGRLL